MKQRLSFISIVSTPWLQGAGDFRKFSVRVVGLGNFWSSGEGAAPLGGAEDFDKFCKNVIEKFSKIK